MKIILLAFAFLMTGCSIKTCVEYSELEDVSFIITDDGLIGADNQFAILKYSDGSIIKERVYDNATYKIGSKRCSKYIREQID